MRDGIWARQSADILKHRRVIIDVDSALDFLWHKCIEDHVRRAHDADLYAKTLVDYTHYAELIRQLLRSLETHQTEAHFVCNGKHMEAPLFGLIAAEFDLHTREVGEHITLLKRYKAELKKNGNTTASTLISKLRRPELALIVFKSLLQEWRPRYKLAHVHQAYYGSCALAARLARDLQCPVISSRTELILTDVRAGFVLFDEFWRAYILSSSSQSPTSVRVHYNRLFLRQHPGLNACMAAHMYALCSDELARAHLKSLQRIKALDKTIESIPYTTASLGRQSRRYQAAAKRLEMSLDFMSNKDTDKLANIIRGEATRLNSPIDDDFVNLHYAFVLASEFKFRLRFILKYVHSHAELNYIEWCLVNRECTASFLVTLLCCSLGRLQSVAYNSRMQLEDLGTRASAFAVQDRAKRMLMSVFTGNRVRATEAASSSWRQQQLQQSSTKSAKSIASSSSLADKSSSAKSIASRDSALASLTIVDREGDELAERVIVTAHSEPANEARELQSMRASIQLRKLAQKPNVKSASKEQAERARFINFVYRCSDITRLPVAIDEALNKNAQGEHKTNIAILVNLNRCAVLCARAADKDFDARYSADLLRAFELALVNATLYRKRADELAKTAAPAQDHSISERVRHMLELLSANAECYYQLNAFLDYPLPKLLLHEHFNPILIYNLTLLALRPGDSLKQYKLVTF